ncbi:MAG: PQQ-dependent sugar dehydrogenase [Xanthomonadales bacterium]|nr:PQQ-dependent sugar dehydrogenase [Xanthomonadales bacterium]
MVVIHTPGRRRPGLAALAALCLTSCSFAAEYRLETWANGLELPWSIAFLPDGSALVTELGGRLRRVDADGQVGPPVANLPDVYFAGQGGLFDVVLHPDFAANRLVYLSYAEGTPEDNGTAVLRGRLGGTADRPTLEDAEVVFRNFSRKDTAVHYGGRLAFLPDGSLLLTTGDGFDQREAAQDVSSGLGKVLRMNDDGSPAAGNPFPGSPYVYSYGHRNPQGLAVSAAGEIWLHEHGPRGGDEVNRIEPGVNYGWPAITYGVDYSGAVISPYTEWEGMAQPVHQWTPSIAPSGLAIYEAGLFPDWRGDLLLGALVDREVRRLDLENGSVAGEEALFEELAARIRDVRVGPGGALFVLTPDRVVRVTPAGDG